LQEIKIDNYLQVRQQSLLDLKFLSKAHRTLFSSYLPPSQGGRYSGFGNQVESGPPRSSSVNDFYEGSVNGITNVSYIQLKT
jgi:hypothetical protein